MCSAFITTVKRQYRGTMLSLCAVFLVGCATHVSNVEFEEAKQTQRVVEEAKQTQRVVKETAMVEIHAWSDDELISRENIDSTENFSVATDIAELEGAAENVAAKYTAARSLYNLQLYALALSELHSAPQPESLYDQQHVDWRRLEFKLCQFMYDTRCIIDSAASLFLLVNSTEKQQINDAALRTLLAIPPFVFNQQWREYQAAQAVGETSTADIIEIGDVSKKLFIGNEGQIHMLPGQIDKRGLFAGWAALLRLLRFDLQHSDELFQGFSQWQATHPSHPLAIVPPLLLQPQLVAIQPIRNVAVMLPFSGGLQAIGKTIQQGMQTTASTLLQYQFYNVYDAASLQLAIATIEQSPVDIILGPIQSPLIKTLLQQHCCTPVIAFNTVSVNPNFVTNQNYWQYGLFQRDDIDRIAYAITQTDQLPKQINAYALTASSTEPKDIDRLLLDWQLLNHKILPQSFKKISQLNEYISRLTGVSGVDIKKLKALNRQHKKLMERAALLPPLVNILQDAIRADRQLRIAEQQQLQDYLDTSADITLQSTAKTIFDEANSVAQNLRRINMQLDNIQKKVSINFLVYLGNATGSRQLRPSLNFYLAEDIPVYMTSRGFKIGSDAITKRDLHGVFFSDIPKVNIPVEYWGYPLKKPVEQSLVRLYAMGLDAGRLAQQFRFLSQHSGVLVAGDTGRIGFDNDKKQIIRIPAMFMVMNEKIKAYDPDAIACLPPAIDSLTNAKFPTQTTDTEKDMAFTRRQNTIYINCN